MSTTPSAIAQLFAGLARTPLLDDSGNVNVQWMRGINSLALAVGAPAVSGTVPTHANSQGSPGQIATDGTYVYVCFLTNQWGRAALSSF
jgi:hypothetical protein